MTTTAQQVRDFYNDTFFDGDQAKSAQVTIAIQSGDKVLFVPTVELYPDDRLDQIFKVCYEELLKTGPVEVNFFGAPTPMEESKAVPLPEVPAGMPLLTDYVTYRGKPYKVQQFDEDRFRVIRQDNLNQIPEKSPVWNAVVKLFKDNGSQLTDH